jgi:hypothetical protein
MTGSMQPGPDRQDTTTHLADCSFCLPVREARETGFQKGNAGVCVCVICLLLKGIFPKQNKTRALYAYPL